MVGINETNYSRLDQVKLVEDSLLKNFTWFILEYFAPDDNMEIIIL